MILACKPIIEEGTTTYWNGVAFVRGKSHAVPLTPEDYRKVIVKLARTSPNFPFEKLQPLN